MTTTKTKGFATNTFYHYAENYRKHPTDENELEQINMTTILYQELEKMITQGEIIIININGKMRLGKSTVAMSIAQYIFELLKKHGYKNKNETFGTNNIARDHQEHSKLMRDPSTAYTVIVTDESNELENKYITEQHLKNNTLDYYSAIDEEYKYKDGYTFYPKYERDTY